MTHQLICEGRCNPLITLADEYVKRFNESKRLNRHFDTGDMIQLQRRLVYTEHSVIHDWASCVDCGAQRQYGGNRPSRHV